MKVSASRGLLHRLLTLALGLIAIRLGFPAGTVALAFIAGALSLIALAWAQTAGRFGRPALRWSPSEALHLYHLAAPFFGLAASAVLYARGALIMLSALTSSQIVGLYAVADRLMVPLGLGPALFNSTAYPALARVAHSSLADARALSTRCLRLLLVVAIPVAALATIFAADVVRLFFGTAYLGAASALQIVAWTLPIRGTQSLLGSQLAAMNQQSALARARFAGLGLFLILCPLLILRWSYLGAVSALLICDSVQLTLYWRLLKRAGAAPFLAASFLAPAAAAAATAAASTLFTNMNLTVRLPVTLLMMAAGMWVSGAIRPHDLKFLQTIMSGKETAPLD